MNSCHKGKRIEREAALFLQSLGFVSARRGAQHRGGPDSPDVICDELPNVHIEVKGDQRIDLGTKDHADAWEQAVRDSSPNKGAALLWKRNRSCWRLTLTVRGPLVLATVHAPADIKFALEHMNREYASEGSENA